MELKNMKLYILSLRQRFYRLKEWIFHFLERSTASKIQSVFVYKQIKGRLYIQVILNLIKIQSAFKALILEKWRARKSEHLARIAEMGLQPFYLSELDKEIADSDICINTIPYPILTAKTLSNVPTHALIIDLASKPGGTDFRYAEKRGIKAILAPGLPGIVAPKTAGQIVAYTRIWIIYAWTNSSA